MSQTTTTFTRALGSASLSVDYAGTREKAHAGASDGQWLRRVSLALPLGRGGDATPGRNLAASVRRRFSNGNELFVNYGTPAANTTLDRWIVKYLMRLGGSI